MGENIQCIAGIFTNGHRGRSPAVSFPKTPGEEATPFRAIHIGDLLLDPSTCWGSDKDLLEPLTSNEVLLSAGRPGHRALPERETLGTYFLDYKALPKVYHLVASNYPVLKTN